MLMSKKVYEKEYSSYKEQCDKYICDIIEKTKNQIEEM